MIRILIADDHAIVRSGLKQIFATTLDICVVGEATRGEDIPEQLKDRQVELLLLDMAMPGLAGIELIRTLRMQQGVIPILVLSMHNEGQIVARALKAGADGYVTKGSEPEVLLEGIRLGNFILTDEEKLYHSGIREFYPGPAFRDGGFEVYIESL